MESGGGGRTKEVQQVCILPWQAAAIYSLIPRLTPPTFIRAWEWDKVTKHTSCGVQTVTISISFCSTSLPPCSFLYHCWLSPPLLSNSSLSPCLLLFSRTRFSLAELRKQPPPEGVDPTKLETYLSDEDFKVCCELVMQHDLVYELASFPGLLMDLVLDYANMEITFKL